MRHESEARLQALLSSLDDLVFELDHEGTYLGIWTADDALLAAPRDEMFGRSLRENVGDDIGVQLTRIVGQVLETGRSETCEYCLRSRPALGGSRAGSPLSRRRRALPGGSASWSGT